MRNTIKCEGKIEGAWESVLSLCGSCLCLFFNFRFCVSAIHFRSLVSSHSAVFFGTTQQVSVFGCLIQYYTLVYLKYFMTVQNKKPLCALLILSSETIYNLNYNSKKNEKWLAFSKPWDLGAFWPYMVWWADRTKKKLEQFLGPKHPC